MIAYHKCPCCGAKISDTTKYWLEMFRSPIYLSYDCGSSFSSQLVYDFVDGKDVVDGLKPYQRPVCVEGQRDLLLKQLSEMKAKINKVLPKNNARL